MQSSLIDNYSQDSKPLNNQKLTEEKIAQPLTQVLEVVTPKDINQEKEQRNNIDSIKQSLDNLFPEQQYEEKTIKKVKEVLGEIVGELTDEQLRDATAEIMFLTNAWLDDFERKTFDGLTLQEVLHERGGV